MKKEKKKSRREIAPKKLLQLIKEASTSAINEAFALGLPVTIEEDGYIVKKYPDGRTKKIKKLKTTPKKVTQKIFYINE